MTSQVKRLKRLLKEIGIKSRVRVDKIGKEYGNAKTVVSGLSQEQIDYLVKNGVKYFRSGSLYLLEW